MVQLAAIFSNGMGLWKFNAKSPPDGIVETGDVAGYGVVGLVCCIENGAPDEFELQGPEEGLEHGIIVEISLAGHGNQDGMAYQFVLVIHRAILAAPIAIINEACPRVDASSMPDIKPPMAGDNADDRPQPNQ